MKLSKIYRLIIQTIFFIENNLYLQLESISQFDIRYKLQKKNIIAMISQ